MTEHDEQHIIAKQPTLLERLRLTDPEAAQAIERLERELANTQAAYKKACDIAAEARAREERREFALNIAASTFRNYEHLHMQKGSISGDAKARTNAKLAEKMEEALAAPAPHPFRGVSPIIDKCGECGEHPDHPIHNPAPAPEPPTSEAERPEDWYCGRCSEVVPLGERCRICGATKRESGVA